jgi:hypothetical protein
MLRALGDSAVTRAAPGVQLFRKKSWNPWTCRHVNSSISGAPLHHHCILVHRAWCHCRTCTIASGTRGRRNRYYKTWRTCSCFPPVQMHSQGALSPCCGSFRWIVATAAMRLFGHMQLIAPPLAGLLGRSSNLTTASKTCGHSTCSSPTPQYFLMRPGRSLPL